MRNLGSPFHKVFSNLTKTLRRTCRKGIDLRDTTSPLSTSPSSSSLQMATAEPVVATQNLEIENPFAIAPVPFDAAAPADFGVDFGTHRHPHPFTFDLPPGCKPWPFPTFDDSSVRAHKIWPSLKLHVQGRCSNKRRLSPLTGPKRRGGVATTSPRGRQATRQAKKQKVIEVRSYGRPPPREDGPLHLMKLPGEIRNQIYRQIAVAPKPLDAQFRRMFCRRSSGRGFRKIVNRYPLEPCLARASKQLRYEVLSIFYGENKFSFARHRSGPFEDFDMTTADLLERWAPSSPAGDAVRHLEWRRNDFSNASIKLELRKLGSRLNLRLEVTNKQICYCVERSVGVDIQTAIEAGKMAPTLVNLAAIFVKQSMELQDKRPSMCVCKNALAMRWAETASS